jgi:predicted acylesterase/phospholipase RssA
MSETRDTTGVCDECDIKITHLVLSGGGMRGVMYLGTLRCLFLENLHKKITHISSNSIGSYVALMFALNISIEDIEKLVYEIVKDDKLCYVPIKNYFRIVSDLGLCSIELFTIHLKRFIKIKYPELSEDISFKDFSKKFGVNLYISTTSINTCENRIFSLEETPDVPVFKACEASMALPFIFKPVKIDGEYYYDGMLTNNFPIKVFSHVPKENIIGMILYKKREYSIKNSMEKISFFGIIKQMYNILDILRVNYALLKEIDVNNLDYYYIPDNIPEQNSINFVVDKKGIKIELTKKQIDDMIFAGFESMTKYIRRRRELHLIEVKKMTHDTLCKKYESSN